MLHDWREKRNIPFFSVSIFTCQQMLTQHASYNPLCITTTKIKTYFFNWLLAHCYLLLSRSGMKTMVARKCANKWQTTGRTEWDEYGTNTEYADVLSSNCCKFSYFSLKLWHILNKHVIHQIVWGNFEKIIFSSFMRIFPRPVDFWHGKIYKNGHKIGFKNVFVNRPHDLVCFDILYMLVQKFSQNSKICKSWSSK